MRKQKWAIYVKKCQDMERKWISCNTLKCAEKTKCAVGHTCEGKAG